STVHHLDLDSFPTRRSSDLFSSKGYFVCLCCQSVKDGIGQRRFVKVFVPLPAGQLGSNDGSALCIPVFQYLKKSELHRMVQGLRSEEHTSELQSRENLVCRL